MEEEKLLIRDDIKHYGSHENEIRRRTTSARSSEQSVTVIKEETQVLKHVNLPVAIGIMLGSCLGTGIFVSPTGVTENVGSVGATLILWSACGALNLLLALCYAELASALPIAGGDYAYIYHLLGPLPAFLNLWTMSVLVSPIAGTVMGRTIAIYFTSILHLECETTLTVLIAVFVCGFVSLLNLSSPKLSGRVATVFTIGKVFAMGIIIISGVVKLIQGNTENYEDIFAGSATSPGAYIVGFLPGFITYIGWDTVTALSEEMNNPERDIPIATFTSLILVTILYVLINVAYFSVLTPSELVQSDATALTYSEKVFPGYEWIISVFVILSSLGTAINLFLACPRWTYAGGRDGQFPSVFSFLSINTGAPVLAIGLMLVLAVLLSCLTFLDLQGILEICSVITQIKISMALIALLKLKWQKPRQKTTIKIPFPFVLLALLLLVAIIIIAVWQNPQVNSLAVIIFLIGIPIYFGKEWLQNKMAVQSIMDRITITLQKLLLIVK